MRSLGVTSLILTVMLLLASCERAPETKTLDQRPEPVVVYAAFEDDAHLQDLFAAYTEETGVLVIVRRGDPAKIVDDLIDNTISPPADVLMTRSVKGVWRAAEEGALRPLYSDSVKAMSPAWSRDPDDLWFGTGYRTAVIATNAAGVSPPDYAALAEPRFEGSLCLSSSANAVSRMVIAMMIEELGVRPAELVVRGWIKNLAVPAFDTEAQLIDAVRSGLCSYGIVSSNALATAMTGGSQQGISVLTPATTYADIDGIGVARHARNSDGAVALIEWLFSRDVQSAHAEQTLTYPANAAANVADALDSAGADNVSDRNVGLVAWHEEAAAKLADRARYRQ